MREWINEWVNEEINGWMSEWINESMRDCKWGVDKVFDWNVKNCYCLGWWWFAFRKVVEIARGLG